MGLLHQSLKIVVVWLTAGSTLVAGVPHFDCVCPNGSRRPCCAEFSRSSGDNNKNGCCSNAGKRRSSTQAHAKSASGCPFCSHAESNSNKAPSPAEIKSP